MQSCETQQDLRVLPSTTIYCCRCLLTSLPTVLCLGNSFTLLSSTFRLLSALKSFARKQAAGQYCSFFFRAATPNDKKCQYTPQNCMLLPTITQQAVFCFIFFFVVFLSSATHSQTFIYQSYMYYNLVILLSASIDLPTSECGRIAYISSETKKNVIFFCDTATGITSPFSPIFVFWQNQCSINLLSSRLRISELRCAFAKAHISSGKSVTQSI